MAAANVLPGRGARGPEDRPGHLRRPGPVEVAPRRPTTTKVSDAVADLEPQAAPRRSTPPRRWRPERSGTTGTRTILLLSDGANSSNRDTLDEATAALATSGATLDAVSFGTDATQIASPQRAGGARPAARSSRPRRPTTSRPRSPRAPGPSTTSSSVIGHGPRRAGRDRPLGDRLGQAGRRPRSPTPRTCRSPARRRATRSASPASASGPIPVTSPAIYDRIDKTWLWAGLIAIFVGVGHHARRRLHPRQPQAHRQRPRPDVDLHPRRRPRHPQGVRDDEHGARRHPGRPVGRRARRPRGAQPRRRGAPRATTRRRRAPAQARRVGPGPRRHRRRERRCSCSCSPAGGSSRPWSAWSSASSSPGSTSASRSPAGRAAFYAQLPDTLQLLAGSLSAGYSLAAGRGHGRA